MILPYGSLSLLSQSTDYVRVNTVHETFLWLLSTLTVFAVCYLNSTCQVLTLCYLTVQLCLIEIG